MTKIEIFNSTSFVILILLQIFPVDSQNASAEYEKKFENFRNESRNHSNEMKSQLNYVVELMREQNFQILQHLQQLQQQLQLQLEKLHQQQMQFEEIYQQQQISKNLTEQFAIIQRQLKDLQLTETATEKLEKQKSTESLHENFQSVQQAIQTNIFEQLQQCQRMSALQTRKLQELEDFKVNFKEINSLPDSCESAIGNFTAMGKDGIYRIYLPESGLTPFEVYCKWVDGEIWTIIQKRHDGTVDFYRDWLAYKNGFGNLNGEFWLGLEKIHELTKRQPHELKIVLRNNAGHYKIARYKKFLIDNEIQKYKLNIGGFNGTVFDCLGAHNGMKFSTLDQDNDIWDAGACAVRSKGGWWFEFCFNAHLNGPFNGDDEKNFGITWAGVGANLKYSQMAMRRLN